MVHELPELLSALDPLDLVIIDEDIGEGARLKDEFSAGRCIKLRLADVLTPCVEDEDSAEPLRREAPGTGRRRHF